MDPRIETVGKAKEVEIETMSSGRSQHTTIWVVVADGAVYVRSVKGERGQWYRRALANPDVALIYGDIRMDFTAVHVKDTPSIDAVTRELIAKYPAGRSLDAMVRDEVLSTTMRLDPRNS